MAVEINIVLVRTIYASNIGAVARVMGNMGVNRLILLDPRCEVNSKARQGAAGAQKHLASRLTYTHWSEFYEKEGKGIRIALTRRGGKLRSVLPLESALNSVHLNRSGFTQIPIYLILGPEDDGLSAEDLAWVNLRAQLPTFGDFPSMNLSHAALLASYIVKNWSIKEEKKMKGVKVLETTSSLHPSQGKEQSGRQKNPLIFPDQTIREWLETLGFSLERRRASAYITMRRLLLQNQPTDTELHVLESILRQNIRKLREK
ncbi:MAG: RNA methyltransferase [Bdellovibrionales bacterium]|nr:RNA methyltransferase [Bdellovibrionales bacterium]